MHLYIKKNNKSSPQDLTFDFNLLHHMLKLEISAELKDQWLLDVATRTDLTQPINKMPAWAGKPVLEITYI